MFLRIMGSPWALVAVWTLGPLLLWFIFKKKEPKGPDIKRTSATHQAPPSQHLHKTNAGVTPLPAERHEVTPGFRDYKWGDSPKPGMAVVHQEGEEILYARREDELVLDAVPLTSINYSFHRDRLQAVMIDMPLASGDTVFKERCAKWGMPKQPSLRQPRFFWLDMLTGMDSTQAVFEKHGMGGKASLIISSKYLKETRERERHATKV
jgi:hypothetical protein